MWIDVAKFLGIFAIYLGHFGNAAGSAYTFVFYYHVPIFFFLSGCMAYYEKEQNLAKYIKKKLKRIMIPFWGFCVLSIVLASLLSGINLTVLKEMVLVVVQGNIRNTFVAGSLWFLTCLFLMEIIFWLLRLIKNKWIIVIICLGMYLIARNFMKPSPMVEPHWLYNLDSVFCYIIFYAIGFVVYPIIKNIFDLDSILKKGFYIVTGSVSAVYALLLLVGVDLITIVCSGFVTTSGFSWLLRAIILIWLNLVIAKLLENISMFNKIGQSTLFLCGNEYVVKTLVICFINMIGLELQLTTPLHVFIYTIILLLLCTLVVIPIEKKMINSVKRIF